jgi:organic radical activating enzyme
MVREACPTVQLIVLTGGDPLRQNIVPLCRQAVQDGYHVQIETAGIRWVPGLEDLIFKLEYPRAVGDSGLRPGVSVVCSPKTGKVCGEMYLYTSAWKYIVGHNDRIDPNDGLPLSSTQIKGEYLFLARPRTDTNTPVYVQPLDTNDEVENAANRKFAAKLAMTYGYWLSLQQHKILGLR